MGGVSLGGEERTVQEKGKAEINRGSHNIKIIGQNVFYEL